MTKGTIVSLNDAWVRHCQYAPWKNYPKGRRALVVGPSRTPECTRVIFDGNKTVTTFHNSFLSPVQS